MNQKGIAPLIIVVIIVVVAVVAGVGIYVATRGGGTVNISDISTHPNQYLGKEVVVEGSIMMIQQGYHMEDWRTVYDNEWLVDIVQQGYWTYWAHTTILYPALTKYSDTTGVTFRFTGTVCRADNSDTWLYLMTSGTSGGYYLKLSNVEIVSI